MNPLERFKQRYYQGKSTPKTLENVVKNLIQVRFGAFSFSGIQSAIDWFNSLPMETAKCKATRLACVNICKKFKADFIRKARISVTR